MFQYLDKVIYVPENKVYDFGYISETGRAVIYEEGDTNMEDSIAVNVHDLIKTDKK